MKGRAGRFLFRFFIVLLVLSVVLGVLGAITVRRSFPQLSGEIQVPGLDKPVEIVRDAFGVPHIYASTRHDLFFAQGYIHAQDRFWQMDFWRHIGSARLSEMFGASQVETDQFLRTLGWARVAQKELEQLDADSLAIFTSYADGVNAYLKAHMGSALSLEYAILKLLNAGYKPEPWQPLNTLTWAKAMAWKLGGNMAEEVDRALLLKILTPEQIDELNPPYPSDHPVIVTNEEMGYRKGSSEATLRQAPEIDYQALQVPFEDLRERLAALDALLGPRGGGIGSNNWVISGQLTATGKPLLANDPHLGIQMPSIWYEVGLHCAPKGPDCAVDLTGFSFAGAPGVVIGHNDKIAWGMTNVGPDVMDLYIEKINPANPNQYEVNGQWVDMTLVKETIQVAGGEPVEHTVRYTRHGPLIWEDEETMKEMREGWGIELPEFFGIALRWTALEVSGTFPALWRINQAQNWEEFRQAASGFAVPSQNLVYADVEGNIGYQMPGQIPIRAAGDGLQPVPGWTDDYEWTGYIPFEELPSSFNPPKGYIVTANNAVVGADYPYMISLGWNYGYRAQRIVEMIESAPGPIDAAYIQKIQGDNKDLNAQVLSPILLQIPLSDTHLEEVRAILQGWDYQDNIDSAQAALFNVFWVKLLAYTFHDELPEDLRPHGGDQYFELMRYLVDQPGAAWWDDRTTVEPESRDIIFRMAFTAAVQELEKLQGKNPEGWRWGDLHTATFVNETLGTSGIAPIEALFNRGPFPAAGGSSIVNATSWDALEPFAVDWLPSMRMIVDLGNLSNSLTVHTTGQSGHAYHPNYIDMADMWRLIQYHSMLWDRSMVEAQAKNILKLLP